MSSGFQSRPVDGNIDEYSRPRPKKRLKIPTFWNKSPQQWRKWLLLFCAGIVCVGFGYIALLWWTLPDISDPRSLIAAQSTVITDRDGVELYRLFEEQDRTYIEYIDIPQHTKDAIVAIEDERFFERGCIDFRAIARAIFANIFRGFKSQGASTITQQLARTSLLTRQKRITRKIKELMLSCALEGKYSKEELLELYLNWIPFGRNAYGIEQASQTYFGISSKDLSLAQSSILAALPQRPTYFSPYGRHVYTTVDEEADALNLQDEDLRIGLIGATIEQGSEDVYVGGRTDQVLRNMQNLGYIEDQERLQALEELETITFQSSRTNIRAPHFVLWIRKQVEQMLTGSAEEGILEQGGLTIETTLDWNLQERAESIVRKHSGAIQTIYGANNIALVTLDSQTKEILTYIGNTDFEDDSHSGKVDMVQAPRQPGSSFKPFVYARAFEEGYSPATVLYDVPTKIGDDEPQNFDEKFAGPITIRNALGSSRNLPAAKSFFLAGREEKILRLTTRMGIITPQQERYEQRQLDDEFEYGWPLALGAAEVPLLEMAHGYSTFASKGVFKPLQFIKKITDKHGNILFESQDSDGEEVLDERIAYQITSILSDPSARPAGYWRDQLSVKGWQVAAKTGTSNKCLEREDDGSCRLVKPNNAWLMGYSPLLTTGVWVGNADSTSMYENGGGLNSASPFWHDFMVSAHRYLAQESEEDLPIEFEQPEDIVQLQISTLSGQLPTECTPVEFRKADVFLKENAPTKKDPACKTLTIDKVTGLLASDECPADAQDTQSFIMVKSILPDRWPEWEEGVQEWSSQQMEYWLARPDHSGAVIPLPAGPTEVCDPDLTPGRLDKPTVRIKSPSGTASYPSFQPNIEFTVGSHQQRIVYLIDGKRTAVVEGSGALAEPVIIVPRSIKKTGEHTLTVEFYDKYFNKAVAKSRFRFEEDKNPPRVELTLPRGDITLPKGDKLSIKATASDKEGSIKHVQFYLGDTLLTTKPIAPYELEYALDVAPGIYRLKAKAKDLAGNVSEDSLKVRVE
jgi:membrane peptidoglycan carboxypeptidase